MKTIKPISNIWFGTSQFLEMKLNELFQNDAIAFWAFVKHFKEEDENKDHIHLYIVPAERIDTKTLNNVLTEIDLNNEKPIKPINWVSSRFDDWYLYTTHNERYLASKGQKRKYHYAFEDYHTSSVEYLNEMVHTIDRSKINSMEVVQNAVDKGISFTSLVASGQIPVQQIQQYEKAYYMLYRLKSVELERNGGKTHEVENEEDLPF